MKEDALQSEGLGREDSKEGNLRREDTQIESLQIEELQRELSVLMQEMLLKHQESDAEIFRIWWEEEGREERYFSLQRRIEELEEAEWKKKVSRIIYFAETPLGKLFDVVLLAMIVLSAMIVILDSVENIRFHKTFLTIEWFMNIIFTAEYIVRIMVVKNKKDYIFSMMGVIDFLSILPFYIGIFTPEAKYLMIIRLFRLLRVFRILNMMDYMDDGHYILQSLRSSSRKIYIFLMFITIIVVVLGALMHIIEGGKNGFHNIPVSIYWAVVTITTVGYGDISPATPLGKLLSVVLMLCGYSIIAVPTGIVSSQMRECMNKAKKLCDCCGNIDNDGDARYCKQCGHKIVEESS